MKYEQGILINNLIDKIYEETKIFSSPMFLEHPYYKALLDMGDEILPYLFHNSISETGFSWIKLSLFANLSGENPIPEEHNGLFIHQVSDWINWFLQSKYK